MRRYSVRCPICESKGMQSFCRKSPYQSDLDENSKQIDRFWDLKGYYHSHSLTNDIIVCECTNDHLFLYTKTQVIPSCVECNILSEYTQHFRELSEEEEKCIRKEIWNKNNVEDERQEWRNRFLNHE